MASPGSGESRPGPRQPIAWARTLPYNLVPALLAWFPISAFPSLYQRGLVGVWAACFACQVEGREVGVVDFFAPLGKRLLVLVMISSAGRALDDMLDPHQEDIDSRASYRTILLAAGYPCWALATAAAVYYLQGPSHLLLWVPPWLLVSLAVAAKHMPALRQLSRGLAVVSLLPAAWSGSRPRDVPEDLLLLAAFTFFWILYVDILLHAALQSDLDGYASPSSPATSLSLLALFQLTSLSIYSYGTGRSPRSWVLGVGGWAASCAWHIQDTSRLEWRWNERAGEAAVVRNVWLGAWLAGVEVGELWARGLLVF
ncbi:hypothetical protein B2J93_1233 [Marssonina coronariae]|uniref:Uncharacterized protein n=1 Tax=Diplocarpon coronariae TaxID=2795749 RepID=A0A218Z2G5_9HELO|nr:hypothetical protein B2J93_1233 [Marssonina coronariae]